MKLASAPVAARSTAHRARIHGTSVVHNGKLLVSNFRDLECDAARALLAKGITGKLHLFDNGGFKVAKRREPWGTLYVYSPRPPMLRTIIDIERAAKLTTEEGPNG